MAPRLGTALRLLRVLGGLAAAGTLSLLAGTAAHAQDEVLVPPSSGSWSVTGHGWGHGIGMSQWGSQGAALQGLSAEQILDFYYPGTVRTDIGLDYPLRVRLLSLAGGTLTAGPTPGGLLTLEDTATGRKVNTPAGARVVITRSGGSFVAEAVQGSSRTLLSFAGATSVAGPVRVASTSGQVWTYNAAGAGRRYVGELRANATGAGSLETVNHVPMEQYLRGVVPRESPSSWAPAALQAQSVAARSYALSVRASSGTADLCDTTQCQVYLGSAESTPAGAVKELHAASTDAAIAATARIARYYGGGPAFTQFSSTNGGFSKAGSRPYLVARADPYTGTAPGDTRTTWTGTLAVARVQQSCPAGGTLQRMVLSRDGNGDLGGRITQARLECSTGVATVATPAFGLYSSWWKATSVGQPFGNLELVDGSSGGVRVKGWVIDPDTTGALTVSVQYGSSTYTTVARLSRPDVAAVYPSAGPLHGFDVTLPAGAGATTVCVTARNVGQGSDLAFPCRGVTVAPGGPYGSLDGATGVPAAGGTTGRATVRGWAVDPDAPTQPIDVEVVVDGATVARATASETRADVGAALPGFGPAHGYTVTVPVGAGRHEVCVRAVNVPSGGSPTLGCSWVTPPSGSPVGNFETAVGERGAVRVTGWAVDPDTVDPVYAYVTVAGQGSYVLGNGTRTDVGRAYPGYGDARGFSGSVPAPEGTQVVCVTLSNVGVGAHTSLGCRTVTVASGSPVGNFESATGTPGALTVRGWALDPDTTAPIYVWASVAGPAGSVYNGPVRASASRGDIARAYPDHGDLHGIAWTLPVDGGTYTVCLTAVNTGSGSDRDLGCRVASVPGGSPVGNLENVRGLAGGVELTGWALDPDAVAAPYVHVTVDGAGSYLRPSVARADITRAFPGYTGSYGFTGTVPAAAGTRTVCATISNVGAGTHTSLGCRTVVVPAR